MKHIVKKDFDGTIIPVPPLPIQQRIVAELDCISGILEKKRQQLKELDNLAQAIFYDMFGDPVENEMGWEKVQLIDVVHRECPISYGIVQLGDECLEGVPVVRPVDLKGFVPVKRDGLKRTSLEISNAYKRTILRGGELLICVRGTTGIMGVADEELSECNVSRGIVPLFFSNKTNRIFMYSLLISKQIQNIIADKTYGATLKQINIAELRKIPIILPPLSLQQQFAKKIEAIERQKALINQSIKEVQTLFDCRMEEYFN